MSQPATFYIVRTVTTREEDSLSENTNANWFREFALHVREIVVEHGGVIVMTHDELIEAVKEREPAFEDCPQSVLTHPTLSLKKRAHLEVWGYGPAGPVKAQTGIYMIHLEDLTIRVARRRTSRYGLSSTVQLRRLELATA